jgi:osmotically-inducible protein OsmY
LQRHRREKDQGDQVLRANGPRTYKRTDDRILEDINDRMCDNPYLDASDIEVGVKDADVVLTGKVEDREAKRMAADIAENVSGVNNVENRLRVELKGI